MRVGLFGGTFNPIHNAHLRLAECALCELGLDKIFFLPTSLPPHKDNTQIIDISHRKKMVFLAIEDNHFFAFSDIEARTNKISYTFETILNFRESTCCDELYYISGADTLPVFHNYKNYETILSNSKLVIAPRPDFFTKAPIRPEVLNATVFLKTFEHIDISSSRIRSLIAERKSIRYLVPEPVYNYIKNKRLYVR